MWSGWMKFEVNPTWSKSDFVSRNLTFAAFALKEVLWITQEEHFPPFFTRFSVESWSKFLRSALLQSFPKIHHWKHQNIIDLQYLEVLKLRCLIFPGTLPNKSEEPCEIWNSLLVGKLWLRGQSLEIHSRLVSIVWTWFGFIHHFMSCAKLELRENDAFQVGWSQSCMKSSRAMVFY